jgi:F-type H+-transporting ATPase subunit delta
VEDVAGMAAAAVARRDGMVLRDEGPLGRTAAAQRLEGYATALLAGVRGEKQLGEVEDELFRFMRTVRGNDELNAVLTTSEVPVQVRQAVVHDILARRATPATVRLATYAAGIGRPRDYPLLLEGLVQRVANEANRQVADVRSAVEMTEAQRRRLAAALTRFVGYEVDVRVSPDPGLLGGFVASVGDMVFDASLRRRLEQARGLLFASSTAPSEAAGRAPDKS